MGLKIKNVRKADLRRDLLFMECDRFTLARKSSFAIVFLDDRLYQRALANARI